MKRLFVTAQLLIACAPALRPQPFRPEPDLEITEACAKACSRLRELGCFDAINCERWLCPADFQDFEAIAETNDCEDL